MATESSLIGNSGFSASSADFRIVHPLSASPATSAFFPPPPPSSCSPPASQQMTTNTSSNGSTNAEDVTTIFVVGFPDDMLEREFQNMFTFSPGFEAASLKWHCKDQDDDTTGSNSNGANGAKKQMIGFARFRTRLEALEAVEVLSGKKIDTEKGAVLKAEMAKKNLHIKRGSIVPTSAPHSGGSATAMAAAAAAAVAAAAHQQQQQHHPVSAAVPAEPTGPSPLSMLTRKMSLHHGGAPPSVYDAFSPLPSDLLSPADYKSDPFNDHPLVSTPTTPAFNDAYLSLRSQSFDTRSTEIVSPPRAFSLYSRPRVGSIHPLMQHQIPQQHQQQHQQQQSVQQQHDPMMDNDPFGYLSKSSPADRANSISTSYFDSNHAAAAAAADSILGSRMGSLSLHNSNSNDLRTPSLSSPSYRPNPADQNPPCNTLYVGNLPPSTSEDELRQLFSKCTNFKRLLFRNKNQQGPMCFVEFEDVTFATQAMNELQGYNLSNSVKGGIRLSFSKNPLFTKPNKQSKPSDIDSPM